MSQDCGNENERGCSDRQMLAGMDGGKHHVCTGIVLALRQIIASHDDKSADREKIDDPGMRQSRSSHKGHGQGKCRPHRANQQTGGNGKNNPFDTGNNPSHICTFGDFHHFIFYHGICRSFLFVVFYLFTTSDDFIIAPSGGETQARRISLAIKYAIVFRLQAVKFNTCNTCVGKYLI